MVAGEEVDGPFSAMSRGQSLEHLVHRHHPPSSCGMTARYAASVAFSPQAPLRFDFRLSKPFGSPPHGRNGPAPRTVPGTRPKRRGRRNGDEAAGSGRAGRLPNRDGSRGLELDSGRGFAGRRKASARIEFLPGGQRRDGGVVQGDAVAPEGAVRGQQALAQRSAELGERSPAGLGDLLGVVRLERLAGRLARKTCVRQSSACVVAAAARRGVAGVASCPAGRWRKRASATTRYRSRSTPSPVSSKASRRTAETKSSPGFTPPPGGRQTSGGNPCLRISASRSPLRMNSVTSWTRAGSYVATSYSRPLISPPIPATPVRRSAP